LPQPAPKKAPQAIDPERYVVGPDDVLDVTILRHPEFSATGISVPGNGLIALPVIGGIQAQGKTVAQLDAEITRKLKVRLLRPEVVVSISRPAPRPLYVVGQVKSPSVLEFKNGWRITQALAASGGLSIESDLAAVVVSRGKVMVADVPLLPILRNPSSKENLELRVGDTLRFYERVVQVNISGAVTKPGLYTVPRGNGVVEAIGLAGGPTEVASLTRASLRRADGTTLPVNLYAALREGNEAQNITLREGDVLSIPEFKDRVSMLGAVKIPGYYSLEDGRKLKIADMIARAGGPLETAALTRATLRRANGQTVSLNLYRLLILGEDDNNLELSANDVLTIPESRGITVIGEVQKPGTYRVEEGTVPRISDALAQAGGLSIKPELAKISVARTLPNGKSVSLSVDAVSLLELSSSAQNTLMQDGDIVSVSALKIATVYINGQVKTPGAYELKEGDGLSGLIARAGGSTDDAALSKLAITSRGGETRIVDAVSILRDGRDLGVALRDGDSIIIPRSQSRILVVGSVTRPGSLALPEDRPITLGDAISLAGGPLSSARVRTLTLLRQTPTGVERKIVPLDRAEGGLMPLNTEIVRPGDVIYLPEGKVSSSTMGLMNSFLPAASILLR
jgi:protein involved in polysaccharide export with SLBB domain